MTKSPSGTSTKYEQLHMGYLHLDMNAVIHPVCQRMYNYGPNKRMISANRWKTPSQIKVFESICNEIDLFRKFVLITNPKQTVLHIVLDGVAGAAKESQQRSRRFKGVTVNDNSSDNKSNNLNDMSINKLSDNLSNTTEFKFDPNCITTGTIFMNKLSIYIKSYIELKSKNEWKGLKVIYSSHLVPGEGEHKIIKFIRELQKTDKISTHCIFSPDADLIMLSLSLNNIHILRENTDKYTNASYLMVDVNNIRTVLINSTWRWNITHTENTDIVEKVDEKDKIDEKDKVDEKDKGDEKIEIKDKWNEMNGVIDYILLCTMLGNDFLPKTSLTILTEGMTFLYNTYPELKVHLIKILDYQHYKEKTIDEKTELYLSFTEGINKEKEKTKDIGKNKGKSKYQLDIKGYGEMLKILANNEANFLLKSKDANLKYPDKLLSIHFKDGKLDFKKYREDYYKTHFNIDTFDFSGKDSKESKEEIEKLCHKYFKMQTFIIRYYLEGIPSWTYKYKYHHIPLFYDLAKYISTFDPDCIYEYSVPAHPIEQLLSVLPPQSAQLLPKEYQSLVTDSNSKIIQYYPKNFEIELSSMNNEYEGIPLIPFVDCTKLKKAFSKIDGIGLKPMIDKTITYLDGKSSTN